MVLETLAPAEQPAFVLHDMFAVPFDEIAPIVGRSPAAARQLASRARRRAHQTRSAARQQWRAPSRGVPGSRKRRSWTVPWVAVWAPGGKPCVVFGFTITGDKIVAIDLVTDPERLSRLDLTVLNESPNLN